MSTALAGGTVCIFVLSVGVSMGQEITGTFVGTVKDQSGAVVPGARVTILNQGTGLTRTIATDQSGNYVEPGAPCRPKAAWRPAAPS